MEKVNYAKLYDKYKNEFSTYFEDDAKLYSEICTNYWTKDVSFETLDNKFSFSTSQIRHIVKNAEKFLNDPESHLKEMKGTVKKLDGYINMPTDFCRGKYNLSLTAHKVFELCIYWYQNKGTNKIHISYLISMSHQCIRYDRRIKCLDELSKLIITLPNGNELKIFENIYEKEKYIIFTFTEECLDYIDPIRIFLKLLKAQLQ